MPTSARMRGDVGIAPYKKLNFYTQYVFHATFFFVLCKSLALFINCFYFLHKGETKVLYDKDKMHQHIVLHFAFCIYYHLAFCIYHHFEPSTHATPLRTLVLDSLCVLA